MWGTGISTARTQAHLHAQLDPVIGQRPASAGPAHDAFPRPIRLGQGVAVIEIPRIDLDAVVVEGVDTASLRKGPGHYPETAYPWEAGGRVAIAGHRTTYLHPFWNLDKLRAGDRITLLTRFGRFDYRVTGSRIVSPADGSVLEPTGLPTLVLTTCNPRFSASQRLVIFARRVSTG